MVEAFLTFQVDRKLSQKSKCGGVLSLIPKKPYPRTRDDLNRMNQDFFASVRVECNLIGNISRKKTVGKSKLQPKSFTNYFYLGRFIQKV